MRKCTIIDKNNYIYIFEKYFAPSSGLYPKLFIRQRSICIDILNNKLFLSPEKDFENFELEDDDYNEILSLLRNRCKELFGFAPVQETKGSNFKKLQDFVAYPFWPQMNTFPSDESFRLDPNGFKNYLKSINLDPPPSIWKLIVNDPKNLAKYKNLLIFGFKDPNIIAAIIDFDEGEDNLNYNANGYYLNEISNFCNNYINDLSEAKLYHLIKPCLYDRQSYDALSMFNMLEGNFALMDGAKEKILKEGFTSYNHDLLRNLQQRYYYANSLSKSSIPNEALVYTKEEKKFECTIDDYEFHLAPDLDFLIELGDKMSNCVGYCYRNAAKQRWSIICYCTKNNAYKICIELRKSLNKYRVVQALGYGNSILKGEAREAINKWIAKNKFLSVFD